MKTKILIPPDFFELKRGSLLLTKPASLLSGLLSSYDAYNVINIHQNAKNFLINCYVPSADKRSLNAIETNNDLEINFHDIESIEWKGIASSKINSPKLKITAPHFINIEIGDSFWNEEVKSKIENLEIAAAKIKLAISNSPSLKKIKLNLTAPLPRYNDIKSSCQFNIKKCKNLQELDLSSIKRVDINSSYYGNAQQWCFGKGLPSSLKLILNKDLHFEFDNTSSIHNCGIKKLFDEILHYSYENLHKDLKPSILEIMPSAKVEKGVITTTLAEFKKAVFDYANKQTQNLFSKDQIKEQQELDKFLDKSNPVHKTK